MSYYVIDNNELYHHGIKGQKWGVRRFQNPDGSLTAKGEKRYNDGGRSIVSNQKLKKPGFVNDRLTPKIDDQKYIKEGTTPIGNKLRKGAGVVKNKISDKHAERKRIKENYKELKKTKMTPAQRMLWGKDTYKKAAKMMEKENMSMNDAVKYAKRRQTGKALAASGILLGLAAVDTIGKRIDTGALDKAGMAYVTAVNNTALTTLRAFK